MATRRPILIGCPQCQQLVSGSYECDEAGEYLLGADGSFLLDRARCDHRGGRCVQTLCVLHRHSRRGPRSWFPSEVVATARRGHRPGADGTRGGAASQPSGSDLDILC